MKKTNFRKILAVLMSAVLMLTLLAACSKSKSSSSVETTGSTEGTDTVGNPVADGMLVVNANGAVDVTYDKDGLVLDLEGIDDNGKELVSEYPEYLGESCSDVVCQLITNSHAAGYLAESNFVVVKQAVGSNLPGTNFLQELTSDANAALQTVGSSAALFVIGEDQLDANGYINLATARDLALSYLGLSDFDSFDGTDAPVNGVYGVKVTNNTLEEDLLIDAVTGSVCPGVLDSEDEDLPDDGDEEIGIEPSEEEDDIDSTTPAPTDETTNQTTSEETGEEDAENSDD